MNFEKVQDEAVQAMVDAFCDVLKKHGIKYDGGTDGVFYVDEIACAISEHGKECWCL